MTLQELKDRQMSRKVLSMKNGDKPMGYWGLEFIKCLHDVDALMGVIEGTIRLEEESNASQEAFNRE